VRKVWSTVVAAVVAVVLMVVGVVWFLSPEDDESPAADVVDETSTTEELVIEPAPLELARRTVLRRDPTYFSCSQPVRRPFSPNRISVQGVTRHATVLAVPRDEHGVPGVPPVSTEGKSQFALDAPGIPPGAAAGNTILTAHTWPDGTAMGNHLLAKLQTGDRLVLRGKPGQGICYRVNERIEVSLVNPPLDKIYATDGPPQIVIIVCSGTRLGPGNWTHRTIWFASPV
jgi:hypothetical protein